MTKAPIHLVSLVTRAKQSLLAFGSTHRSRLLASAGAALAAAVMVFALVARTSIEPAHAELPVASPATATVDQSEGVTRTEKSCAEQTWPYLTDTCVKASGRAVRVLPPTTAEQSADALAALRAAAARPAQPAVTKELKAPPKQQRERRRVRQQQPADPSYQTPTQPNRTYSADNNRWHGWSW
jgi:hypothetical protein